MAHSRAGRNALEVELVILERAQYGRDVERNRRHPHELSLALPLGAWAVAIDLDAVPVGVAQVDRLADQVVRHALERDLRVCRICEPTGEVVARREEKREMEEARVARCRRRAGLLVQHEEVLGAGAEAGGAVVATM